MKSYIKKWIKDEKRIIRLAYRKGLIREFELENICWEYLRNGKRGRKRKNLHAFTEYLPEIHLFGIDYWGEYDSHSVVDHINEKLWWDNHNQDDTEDGYWGTSSFRCNSRIDFINYLKNLRTVTCSTRINKYLIRNTE